MLPVHVIATRIDKLDLGDNASSKSVKETIDFLAKKVIETESQFYAQVPALLNYLVKDGTMTIEERKRFLDEMYEARSY